MTDVTHRYANGLDLHHVFSVKLYLFPGTSMKFEPKYNNILLLKCRLENVDQFHQGLYV